MTPLFYQPDLSLGHLAEEESRHAVKVLRLTEGSVCDITDGKGQYVQARLTKADARQCPFLIIERKAIPKRPFSIHLAIAPTKNMDRMEWMVEKSVEMGIERISFLQCKTSERTSLNMERVEKIAVSAMKQSQQAWLPDLAPIMPFSTFVRSCQENLKFITTVDKQNPRHLKDLAPAGSDYAVLVGPEGDFSAEELAIAGAAGFLPASLGPNRLRTETAGLFVVAVLNLVNH